MAKTKRQVREEIVASLEVNETVVIQKRPYTAINVSASYDGEEYIGVGFSKVSWPDKWDAEQGYAYAEYRAKKDIANQIMAEKRLFA